MGPNTWGHGGQTLGYLSAFGIYPGQGISFVAWSTSSTNILGLGDLVITEALSRNGVLLD